MMVAKTRLYITTKILNYSPSEVRTIERMKRLFLRNETHEKCNQLLGI